MAKPTRTSRQWFQDTITGPLGKRFNTGNKPDKVAFKALFDSFLNPAEVDDTASTEDAGHVKIATDTYVQNRVDNYTEALAAGIETQNTKAAVEIPHTAVVRPHHLPNMEGPDGTEVSGTSSTLIKDGLTLSATEKTVNNHKRRNFRIALNLGGSLKTSSEKLVLDGDEDTPDDGKVYGKQNGQKGWFASFIPSFLWSPIEKKHLASDGLHLFWDTIANQTGNGYSPDNKSIVLDTLLKLALKLRSTTLGIAGKAAVIAYDNDGVYITVDGTTLKANASGVLEGLEADNLTTERTTARTLIAKLMYTYYPPTNDGVAPPLPQNELAVSAPVIRSSVATKGLHVLIDPATLGWNSKNQLLVKSTISPDKVTINDEFDGSSIDGKWSNTNAVMTTDTQWDINGILNLPVTGSTDITYIAHRSKATVSSNPQIVTRALLNLAVAANANSPKVYIGYIGYDGTTVKDFIGFSIDSTGYWKVVVIKNTVVTNSVVTEVPLLNTKFYTFDIAIKSDGSAVAMIDNVVVATFPASTCAFTYPLSGGLDIRNTIAEANNIYVDYISLTRDRDYSRIV